MDDDIKKIINKALQNWEGETINDKKLGELKEMIFKKTGKHKFLPYTNLKKWIKEVKRDMKDKKPTKKVETKKEKPTENKKVVVNVNKVKEEKVSENVSQKAVISPFQDRVLFQNLSYEISSMRRALERISKQLDDLEGTLKEINNKEE